MFWVYKYNTIFIKCGQLNDLLPGIFDDEEVYKFIKLSAISKCGPSIMNTFSFHNQRFCLLFKNKHNIVLNRDLSLSKYLWASYAH